MLPGGTNDERQTTMEDSATQPLGCWKAVFRNLLQIFGLKFATMLDAFFMHFHLWYVIDMANKDLGGDIVGKQSLNGISLI